jgi:hypothetical protein
MLVLLGGRTLVDVTLFRVLIADLESTLAREVDTKDFHRT